MLAYSHGGDPASTGCSITGGAFYDPATARFPSGYQGDYFYADYVGGVVDFGDERVGKPRGTIVVPLAGSAFHHSSATRHAASAAATTRTTGEWIRWLLPIVSCLSLQAGRKGPFPFHIR